MIADVNPFIYSHPVAPEEIIDRDGETRELLTAAVGGHYVRLYGPRKYGKTSLLRRVLLEGERGEGLIPVLVDLYGVLSVADVAIRFERAYAKQLKGKVRSRIEEFLQSTGLGLSLGALGISARLQLEPRTDPLPALHALLDLPLRLEETGGFRALIVLDEFQDITKVREMDALIRSHIQFQGDVASFVFAGSEPGLMRELFENGDRPLYGQAVPMRLGRLADADIAEYIVARFRETGRSAGEAVNPLVASARGHPQRAMLLAHRLWAVVSEGGSATLGDWGTAHMAALAELQPEFDAHWRRLSTSAQRALRAVVGGEGSPFQQRVLEQLDLRKSTARAALQALVGNATVEQEAELYVLIDPLFAEWIANLRESGGDDLSA
ncbi:MAG: AAA family ATPase [Gaiellaceae bacterium]